jgi:trans-2,3-dihydro-3-hydroxyanthranilate isomerase
MADYDFETVDVFTDRLFGGNPLAVLPDARGLTDAQMQAIAREFNYSETTFVLPPDDPAHTARVRIFTPSHEMPFAGHPNVGTGYVLATLRPGEYGFVFEEVAGLVHVEVNRDAAGAPHGARIAAPRPLATGIAVPTEQVAACAGLDPEDICTTSHEPLVAGTGADFVFAELNSAEALDRATPDLAAFRAAVASLPDLEGRLPLLLYVRDADDPSRIAARMFAPLGGIIEDPATGSACAALAALLVAMAPGADVSLRFEIAQGVAMGRPSLIVAEASKTGEGGVHAHVGGTCVPVMRGRITV